jgi:hypothetical protein
VHRHINAAVQYTRMHGGGYYTRRYINMAGTTLPALQSYCCSIRNLPQHQHSSFATTKLYPSFHVLHKLPKRWI